MLPARPRAPSPSLSLTSLTVLLANSQVEVELLMGQFERAIRESVAEFLRYAFALSVNSLTLGLYWHS